MSRIVLAANYNCSDSPNSAYGAAAYGTCETSTSSGTGTDTDSSTEGTSLGAPNTGFLQQLYAGGSFTILAPLVLVIVLVAISAVVLKKKAPTRK
ncbi:MAG: hypothetical protein UY35_C0007G0044 [Candidatus Saccharibacteria bacterium GW2011_GWC2_48_9]|nr:MAG: hypothetical protein UY35_C0007G0044 [Candidatus Saccharibacteria bacterium GW2011_GWC2_48_9]HCH34698.1 hypothetical protein [Candidatus Saccharibacteria bacterium]